MSNVLKEICDRKREHIAACKQALPFSEIEAQAKAASPLRGFERALENSAFVGAFGLIAEIKKASPSKGLIRDDFDPVEIAKAYESGGAQCLSILTDEPYFQGKNEHLIAARNAVSLPVLRKDFMLDPYQITESRAIGADCILLIMAALDGEQPKELEQQAMDLGMSVLVEVHNEQEMDDALDNLQSRLIGINNRNLKTLEVDVNVTVELSRMLPHGAMGVSESGLQTKQDLDHLSDCGVYCFLVGESLMRQNNVELALKTLLGVV
jgi:indole-3-glycerol phosphate synthase